MAISEVSGQGDDGGGDVKERAAVPMYSMQALWDGKMMVKDFEVERKDHLPHNIFEQDEALPVIDVQALLGADKEASAAQMATMLDAAKTWGFFKIRNQRGAVASGEEGGGECEEVFYVLRVVF